MPYIPEARKKALLNDGRSALTPGELTFVITFHCLEGMGAPWTTTSILNEIDLFLDTQPEPDYAALAQIVGCLQCARMEYRRRLPDDYLDADEALGEAIKIFYSDVVVPYENQKIVENGDVF